MILALCASVEKFWSDSRRGTSCYVFQPIHCSNFDKDNGLKPIYLRRFQTLFKVVELVVYPVSHPPTHSFNKDRMANMHFRLGTT
jgi:hypothetical protein